MPLDIDHTAIKSDLVRNGEPLAFQEHQPPSILAVFYWARNGSDYIFLIRTPNSVHVGIRGREVGGCVQVLLHLPNIPGCGLTTKSAIT